MLLNWNKIKFINKFKIKFEKDILTKKLVTVPAAPAFVENKSNVFYWKALRAADFCVIDSSLFAILARLTGLKIFKFSGFQLIKESISYLHKKRIKILLVNPGEESGQINKSYLLNNTKLEIDDICSYSAPIYPKHQLIEDFQLLDLANLNKPRLIIINIAGGKQEVLGHFLKQHLSFPTTIICTGAAISFFTGEQANIPNWVDKMHLGWLARIIQSPNMYLLRYLRAFRFIPMFFKYKIERIKE